MPRDELGDIEDIDFVLFGTAQYLQNGNPSEGFIIAQIRNRIIKQNMLEVA